MTNFELTCMIQVIFFSLLSYSIVNYITTARISRKDKLSKINDKTNFIGVII